MGKAEKTAKKNKNTGTRRVPRSRQHLDVGDDKAKNGHDANDVGKSSYFEFHGISPEKLTSVDPRPKPEKNYPLIVARTNHNKLLGNFTRPKTRYFPILNMYFWGVFYHTPPKTKKSQGYSLHRGKSFPHTLETSNDLHSLHY